MGAGGGNIAVEEQSSGELEGGRSKAFVLEDLNEEMCLEDAWV